MQEAEKNLRDSFPDVVRLKVASPGELEELELALAARRRPPSLPPSAGASQILESWADYLSPLFGKTGAVHFTGTYSDDYGTAHGLMLARNVLSDFRAFYRTLGRPKTAPVAIGVEKHPSGRKILHLHVLMGGDWTVSERELLVAEWQRYRGWARATPVNDRDGCLRYAAKHVMKQGEDETFTVHIPFRRHGGRHEARRARGDVL